MFLCFMFIVVYFGIFMYVNGPTKKTTCIEWNLLIHILEWSIQSQDQILYENMVQDFVDKDPFQMDWAWAIFKKKFGKRFSL